ncbi:POZ/BTB containin G-protein 1 [Striga asiatica]|uniref:POZ/BTB containin G-protein 1 n=1 Tax=Striga asiatica TaxID=4170 RepID=A0A5A7PKM5_STRAF|nr:POZ/BTB containin G-protein 1 [Striga asiatica]
MMDPNDPSLKYWFIQSKKHGVEVCSDWVRYLLDAELLLQRVYPYLQNLRLGEVMSISDFKAQFAIECKVNLFKHRGIDDYLFVRETKIPLTIGGEVFRGYGLVGFEF